MESKRQSKLPDGLGKKIIQALKTQGSADQSSVPSNESGPHQVSDQQQNIPVDEHGLQTISRMDFGSQEMEYDSEPNLQDYNSLQLENIQSIPDLDSTSDPLDVPQYGSFVDPSQIDYKEDQFTYDEFSYNQQSYEGLDIGSEEIPEYQTPQLGYSEEEYPQEYEESSGPDLNYYQQDYSEFQNYNEQEYSDYNSSEIPESKIPDLDQYNDYSYQSSYEETDYQEDSYNNYEEPQIGFSNKNLLEEQDVNYHDQTSIESYETSVTPRTIDLDSVGPSAEPIPQRMPETNSSRDPLNLDQSNTYRPEHQQQVPQNYQSSAAKRNYQDVSIDSTAPVFHDQPRGFSSQENRGYKETQKEDYQQPEERFYQEPPKDYYRPEERFYQEPPKDYHRPEERFYQEPPKDYHRPEERFYQEPPKDYHRPEERFYQEPPKDYYRPEERFYGEQNRGYHRTEERFYQEAPKDYFYTENKYQQPETKFPKYEDRESLPFRQPSKPSQYRGELFNSNIDTLIRLVSSLPPGVTRQTGAHIIRQTMEAMGISMSDVLSDAQGAQARLQHYVKENFNIIEEHKILIKRLEEDIHTYQRKAKELDDIINLFILTEQGPKGR